MAVAEQGATASPASSPVKTEQSDIGGGLGVSPMEGVVFASTLTPTRTASSESGTCSAAAAVVSPRATPSLEERPVPPDCSPPPAQAHAAPSTTPSPLFRPIAPALAGGEGGALGLTGVKVEGGVVGGGGGGAGVGVSGGGGCDGAVGGSGVEVSFSPGAAAALCKPEGADTTEVAAAAAATGEAAAKVTATAKVTAARLAAATVAASTAAAVATVAAAAAAKREGGVEDSMEVEEDVGAEAAGDASCGSAASDSFDVSVFKRCSAVGGLPMLSQIIRMRSPMPHLAQNP